VIKLTIPGQPMGKQRPKFGKGRTYTPEKTMNYETLVQELYIIGNYGKQLEGELGMSVKAYFQPPKKLKRCRPTTKPDWDNVGKIISDALNGLAYKDDSQIVTATVEKHYSDEPRVEVLIWNT
jgi:Holliday junction resolvase RusA-like endonuclease